MKRRAIAALAAFGLCCVNVAIAENRPQARAVARGAVVFKEYCALCHGLDGKGNGRAARLHNPVPVDLTRSAVNDMYRELIIRSGGVALGRSPAMPPWQDELTAAQIRDVIVYLRVLSRRTQ